MRRLLPQLKHFKRFYANEISPIDNREISLKSLNPFVGTGRCMPVQGQLGRSSDTGRTVTVFGASGFLGRYIVHILAKEGNTVVVPFDGEEDEIGFLKVTGDLGKIIPLRFDLESPKQIIDCVKDSHVVVNCISREYDTIRFDMEQVNVEGAARIAQACALTNVPAFIHLSDIRATSNASNRFLKSKFDGEQAVTKAFSSPLIVRTSTLYGHEDRFCYMLAMLATKGLGFPVLSGHRHTKLHPLYVGDAAYGISQMMKDEANHGISSSKYFDFKGPEEYDFVKLNELFGRVILRPFTIREISLWTYRMLGLSSFLWRKPMFKYDQIKTLHTEEVDMKDATLLPDIAGMRPLSLLEDDAIKFLRVWRYPEDYELPALVAKAQ